MDVVQPRDLGHHLSNLHVPASSQTVQGSELMRSNTAAESALLLGGDLLVTVWQASPPSLFPCGEIQDVRSAHAHSVCTSIRYAFPLHAEGLELEKPMCNT